MVQLVIAHGGNPNFIRANFTDGTFDTNRIVKSNFSNSQSVYLDISSSDLFNANLTGATNLDTSTRTGITWSNTTCPDGTNSDTNGNTCEGHLTP